MKSIQEIELINNFCEGLATAMENAGLPTFLLYNFESESVLGEVKERPVEIDVSVDSIEKAVCFIIRGLNDVLQGD